MTDQPLNYQTPPLDRPTPMRTAAWISLLVLGILYALGGLCVAFSGFFIVAIAIPAAGGGRGGHPDNRAIIGFVMAVMFLLTMAIGVIYLISAFRVRKRSRAATIIALITSILNVVALGLMVCMGLIGVLMRADKDPGTLFAILFYLLPVAANAWVTFALIKLLREKPTLQS